MNNKFSAIEDKYFIRAFDYKVGDIVQMRSDGFANSGRIGIITGIRADHKNKNRLAYELLFPKNETFVTDHKRIRLLRAAGSDKNETRSQFFE